MVAYNRISFDLVVGVILDSDRNLLLPTTEDIVGNTDEVRPVPVDPLSLLLDNLIFDTGYNRVNALIRLSYLRGCNTRYAASGHQIRRKSVRFCLPLQHHRSGAIFIPARKLTENKIRKNQSSDQILLTTMKGLSEKN
jgi:hypothetical protein